MILSLLKIYLNKKINNQEVFLENRLIISASIIMSAEAQARAYL